MFKTSAKCRLLGGLLSNAGSSEHTACPNRYLFSVSLLSAFIPWLPKNRIQCAERGRLTYTLVRFENCVTEELLMRKNYISSHSRDHADSECVSYVGVNSKETEFYR